MTTNATPPLKKVPIHLQSAANRILIKNGTVVNADDQPVAADVYIEVCSIPHSNIITIFDITFYREKTQGLTVYRSLFRIMEQGSADSHRVTKGDLLMRAG